MTHIGCTCDRLREAEEKAAKWEESERVSRKTTMILHGPRRKERCDIYTCSECGASVAKTHSWYPRYCSNCGRKVTWR